MVSRLILPTPSFVQPLYIMIFFLKKLAMKSILKAMVAVLLIIQFTSCVNTAPKPIPKKQSEIHKVDNRIRIDSLLKSNHGNNYLIAQMGHVNNLDKIFGFRGLRFNMLFNSINFLQARIDTNEFDRSIITVSFSADLNVIGNNQYDDLDLVFYNNRLTTISISETYNSEFNNSTIKPDVIVNDIIDKQNGNPMIPSNNTFTFPLNGSYKLLETLYGKPNIQYDGFLETYVNKSGSTHYLSIDDIDIYNKEAEYFDEKLASWKSDFLILTYNGIYYYDSYVTELGSIKLIKHLKVHIEYSLTENKNIINENIKYINDTFKKEKKNQDNIDLIKKF